MIKSFQHKGYEALYFKGSKKGVDPKHATKLLRIADRLNAADDVYDMSFPGSALHLLEPRSKGVWAVKVSGNWRVTFRFEGGDAFDVNYRDYH